MSRELLTIRNISPNQVLLRFRSGSNGYLAPGAVLEGVEPVEVAGNHWIDHLRERRLIVVEAPGKRDDARKERLRSGDMRAEEVVEHIRSTPLEELKGFLSDDEQRVTVMRAMEEKRGG